MELSFVIAALRKRWWLVLFFAQMGLWPLYLGGSEETVYESSALLEILEPDDMFTFASVPDRYLLSQLEVLGSPTMAEEVTAGYAPDLEPAALRRAMQFEHLPETDVVIIQARFGDAEQARQIAQGYAQTYIAQLQREEAARRDPMLADYDAQLVAARDRLNILNEQLRSAMAAYVDRVGTVGVPDPSLIVPEVVVERDLAIAEVGRLTRLRDEVTDEGSVINSQILQAASLPTDPVPGSSNSVGYAFALGGLLIGVSGAILLARFSTQVLDETAAGDIIGVPIVGATAPHRTLRMDPMAALERLPQSHIAQVDQICVRAEALGSLDRPLVVAVVGSQRGAGATTLALSMAARMAAADYTVLVVDADRRDPWISTSFGTARHGGINTLAGLSNANLERIFTRSTEPQVRALGFGGGQMALRRDVVPAIVAGAREAAEVIIVDGGPLLEAASTVEFCLNADAVVLAVPGDGQRADDLAAVARQLQSMMDRVVPVRTAPIPKPAPPAEMMDHGADSNDKLGYVIPTVARRQAEIRTNGGVADGAFSTRTPPRSAGTTPAGVGAEGSSSQR